MNKPEPYFFSNFNHKQRRKKMAKAFSDENLIEAVAVHDSYDEVHTELAKTEGVDAKDIPKIAVKNAVQRLMVEEGVMDFKRLKPYVVKSTGYAPKMYGEYTRLGVMIPRHLLRESDFVPAKYENKKKVKDGSRFKVKFTKKSITLTLMED